MSKKQENKSQLIAPELAYRPRHPQQYQPAIGLIGCGDVTHSHLTAYTHAGYQVVALCDIDEERAKARRTAFYPAATVYTNYHDLLSRDDIEVVDIATHPANRAPIIEAALRAKKHAA